jgi:hypothetical protein
MADSTNGLMLSHPVNIRNVRDYSCVRKALVGKCVVEGVAAATDEVADQTGLWS